MRTCLIVMALAGLAGCAATEKPARPFASATIDIGVVVSDVEKAAAFYKDALGFTEVPGFDVPASMGRDSGLTDGKPFHVRVMKLADTPTATCVKLIQFAGVSPARQDTQYIHSTLGPRYLTIHVTDTKAAVERARRHGATVVARGPVPLPEGFPKGVYLTVLRDPDGNMVEFVGP